MHNIDRTQTEQELGYESDEFGANTYEFEFESDGETYGEVYGEAEGVLNEADEMELAAELLEVSDEAELDQFLGKLFKRVGRTLGRVVKSPIGRALGGMLRGIAKKALPVLGGALGTVIPIPGVGTALGSALGNAAGQMFGLELEGMSAEDQEFEVARRFVRLAGDAAQQAANASPSGSPQAAAQQAILSAAQKHAPGLMNNGPAARANGRAPRTGMPRTGQWIRRGKHVILLGVYR